MVTVLKILADNNISRPGFVGEHGFSVLIKRGGEKILFDTGAGFSLPLNLKAFEENLKGVTKIVISHGHYDHTSGLKWAVQQTGQVAVVAQPGLFSRHMAYNPEDPLEKPRYIGCPQTQEELEDLGACFNWFERTSEISPGLWFITGIERRPELIPRDPRLVLPAENGQVRSDPLEDDASLLLETESFPVLLLGCAHGGILNILDHIQYTMGINRLRAILGGTHLMVSGPEAIDQVVDRFEEFSVELVGTSHCTGFQAAIKLANHFGRRFEMASAGSVFRF